MVDAVLYVSRSTIPETGAVEQFMDIKFTSLARNSALDLTGFLIATPVYFAQFLQGKGSSLGCVMQSIRRDERHTEIDEAPLLHFDELLFPRWQTGWFGPGSFTHNYVERLLGECHGHLTEQGAAALLRSMKTIFPAGTSRPFCRHSFAKRL